MARKTTYLRTRNRLLATAVSACFMANAQAVDLPAAATLLPTGWAQNSNAVFSLNPAGNLLTVTTQAQRTVLQYDQFNIAAGYGVNFIQPSSSSSVLNRVLAADPSVILGTLTSNGRVFLINPNGIYVGQGARIDVAGFVASTLNLSDANFLANKLQFEATPGAGAVVNQGSIASASGGSVYLVATNVTNEGIITTPQGETILAAGQTVTLLDTATPGVSVEITGAAGNATNLGQIVADAGRIGIAGALVRNSGTLNASSAVNEGGRIFLKASRDAYVDGSGRIVATGTKGGKVDVLGNQVSVTDSASIDASGTNGGGTVLIGGDYQGKNPAVQNSQTTSFGENASIKADATDSGDGGKVIVWADGTTEAYGSIGARGGAKGGNGGFVETSGKQHLDFKAQVDTRAPLGKTGSLLLDPGSFNIDIATWNSTFGTQTSNLVLSTDASGTGNIDFYGAGVGSFGFDLTLLAYGGGASTGNISFGSGVTLGVSGMTQMIAGWDGNPTAPGFVAGKGNITFTDSTLTSFAGVQAKAGGNITLTATAADAVIASPGVVGMVAGGDITLSGNAGAGNVVFIGSGNNPGGGSVALYATGQFTADDVFIGSKYGGSPNSVLLGAGGNMTLSNSVVGNLGGATGAIKMGAGIQVAPNGDINASSTGGTLTLDSGTLVGDKNFASTATIEIHANAGSAAASGNVLLEDAGIRGGNISVYGGGNLDLTALNSPTGILGNGDMWVDVAGNININGGDSVVTAGGYAGLGAYAGLRANGFQHVGAGGNIVLQAGDANNLAHYGGWSYGGSVSIMNWGGALGAGTQEIAAHSIELRAGATGHDNAAVIQTFGTGGQTITINGGQLLVKGGGDASTSVYGGLGSFNNGAELSNFGTGPQTIIVNGGGAIVVQGGDGTGTLGGFGGFDNGSNNSARIDTNGSAQTIDFYGGGSLTIYGGGAGTDNYANIDGGYSGEQKIWSSTGAHPSIAIYGGSSGGGAGSPCGPGCFEGASNDAGIHLDENNLTGTQTIFADSLYIAGGNATYGGAGLGGARQNIAVTHNLTMLGGGSSAIAADGAPGSAAYIGNMYGAQINLNVGGDFTATGGSGAGGAVLVGSLASDALVDIVVAGSVTLNGAASVNGGGVRIGSDALTAAGHVTIDAGRDITINGYGGGVGIGAKDTNNANWDYVHLFAGNSSNGGNLSVSGAALINAGSGCCGSARLEAHYGSIAGTGNIDIGAASQVYGYYAYASAGRNVTVGGYMGSVGGTFIDAGNSSAGGSIHVTGTGNIASGGYEGVNLLARSGSDGAATGSITLDAGSQINAYGGYYGVSASLIADRNIVANGSIMGDQGVTLYAGGNITVGDGVSGHGLISAPNGAISVASGTYAGYCCGGFYSALNGSGYSYLMSPTGGNITVNSGANLHARDWLGLYAFGVAAGGGNVTVNSGSTLLADGVSGVSFSALDLIGARNVTVNGSVTAGNGYAVYIAAGQDPSTFPPAFAVASTYGGDVLIGGQLTASGEVEIRAFSDALGAGGNITQSNGSVITGDTVMVSADRGVSLDGNILATADCGYCVGSSVNVSAGNNGTYGGNIDLLLHSALQGGYRIDMQAHGGAAANGDIKQASGSTVKVTGSYGYASQLRADGDLLLDGSIALQVTDGSAQLDAFSGYAGASGRTLRVADLGANYGGTINLNSSGIAQVGVINAPAGSVTINANGAILDQNGNSLNITANFITLNSLSGGAANGLAISMDTAANNGIGGYVGSYAAPATYGGIAIRNVGAQQPAEYVRMKDHSTYGGGLSFTNTGDVHTGSLDGMFLGSYSGKADDITVSSLTGDIYLDGGSFEQTNIGGTLTFDSPRDIFNSASLVADGNMSLLAGRDFFGYSYLAANVGVIDLKAQNVSLGNSSGFASLNAYGGVSIDASGEVILDHASVFSSGPGFGVVDIVAKGGAVSLDASHIGGGEGVNIGATGVSLDNGSSIITGIPLTANVEMVISQGDLTLNNGSYIHAGNDVLLTLSGSNAVVSLGDVDTATGLPGSPSHILTGAPFTTHINFLGRSSGGVLIDGEPTTTTVYGGSGFYNVDLSTPASPGSGLEIAYGVTETANVAAKVIDEFFAELTDTAPVVEATQPTETASAETKEEEEKKQQQDDKASDEGKKENEQKPSKVGQCT